MATRQDRRAPTLRIDGRRAADEQGGAATAIKDPNVKFFAELGRRLGACRCSTASIPVKVALLYYKQLQAAFAGKTSPPGGDAER